MEPGRGVVPLRLEGPAWAALVPMIDFIRHLQNDPPLMQVEGRRGIPGYSLRRDFRTRVAWPPAGFGSGLSKNRAGVVKP